MTGGGDETGRRRDGEAIGTTTAGSGPDGDDFGMDTAAGRPAGEEETLIVDVGGFEGPLDLLLALARTQKVDLARISILTLAEQYLAFVERARDLRLDLAADHLVMAAWLAYLKSRLLLPRPPADAEPSGEELAAALALRLRRLEAMRTVAARLLERDRFGVTVFGRGAVAEPSGEVRRIEWQASLWDLLSAYAHFRERTFVTSVRVGGRAVWSLADARALLERLVGPIDEWTPVAALLADWLTPEDRRTVIASTFAASLELAREGRLELKQTAPFAPIHARAGRGVVDDGTTGEGEA